jgi:hypothetical protein
MLIEMRRVSTTVWENFVYGSFYSQEDTIDVFLREEARCPTW